MGSSHSHRRAAAILSGALLLQVQCPGEGWSVLSPPGSTGSLPNARKCLSAAPDGRQEGSLVFRASSAQEVGDG